MSSPVAASNTGLIVSGESAEFVDDFDEDDDLFFNQSQSAPTASNNRQSSTSQQQQSTAASMSSFGMLALSYNDVTPISSSTAKWLGGSSSRPTSPTSNFDNTTPQDSLLSDTMNGIDQDDIELIQLDKQYLSILRNPNSTYHSVAKVCLALHQLCNNSNSEISSISSTNNNNYNDGNLSNGIQIVSSTPIIQIKSHQLKIHAILSSLTQCLSTHTLPAVRILSTSTLVTIAKSNYALLNYPHSINCTRTSSVNSAITNLQDDCGVSLAYTLVTATLEQVNDSVSAAALLSLGKLTLDTSNDSLLAEVRSIAECVSIGFECADTSHSNLDKDHAEIMKLMSSKIYEFVIFPRMSSILHRVSLYTTSSSPSTSASGLSIAKTLPILTATIIHALTKGKDTIPSRRLLQGNKSTHGKRGWRENDAISIAKEYVVNLLLPLLDNGCEKTLQRAISVALIRMSNACPLAQWRVMACRYACTILLQQLNSEMGSASSFSMGQSQSSCKKAGPQENDIVSYTISSSMVPTETLAGTAALLVIALRGIPLNEPTVARYNPPRCNPLPYHVPHKTHRPACTVAHHSPSHYNPLPYVSHKTHTPPSTLARYNPPRCNPLPYHVPHKTLPPPSTVARYNPPHYTSLPYHVPHNTYHPHSILAYHTPPNRIPLPYVLHKTHTPPSTVARYNPPRCNPLPYHVPDKI